MFYRQIGYKQWQLAQTSSTSGNKTHTRNEQSQMLILDKMYLSDLMGHSNIFLHRPVFFRQCQPIADWYKYGVCVYHYKLNLLHTISRSALNEYIPSFTDHMRDGLNAMLYSLDMTVCKFANYTDELHIMQHVWHEFIGLYRNFALYPYTGTVNTNLTCNAKNSTRNSFCT